MSCESITCLMGREVNTQRILTGTDMEMTTTICSLVWYIYMFSSLASYSISLPGSIPQSVIRYDLEFLGWCPCMIDVEIIDAKAGNASTLVQSGLDSCTCTKIARPDHSRPELHSRPNLQHLLALQNTNLVGGSLQ
jgi:hypothetical protein